MQHLKCEAPPVGDGASDDLQGWAAEQTFKPEYTNCDVSFQARRSLTSDPRLCRLAERVHSLGPRPFLELLTEIGDPDDVRLALERYAKLSPEIVWAIGGDKMPGPMLAEVGR